MSKQHVTFGCRGRHVGHRVTKSVQRRRKADPAVAAIAKAHGITVGEARRLLIDAQRAQSAKSAADTLTESLALQRAYARKQQLAQSRAETEEAARRQRVADYLATLEG